MSRSLVRRSAWQIALLVGGLLLVFALATWWLVTSAWRDALDRDLWSRARATAALCEWEGDGPEGDPDADPAGGLPGGFVECDLTPARAADLGFGSGAGIRVWALGAEPHAGLLFRFGALPGGTAAGAPLGRPFQLGGFRVLTTHWPVAEAPLPDAPVIGVEVAMDLTPLRARTSQLLRYLALVGCVCLGMGALLGTGMVRRILRPVRQLGAAAERVAQGGSVSVPRDGSGDELDRLAALVERAFRTQADSLARQARFTADAAHELRNPIASIQASAEVGSRAGRSPEEMRTFLAAIAQSSARMGQTVAALLELARLHGGHGTLERQLVALRDLAREPMSDPRVAADVADLTVHGDPRLLDILLCNLLDNALRHAGERVVVRAEATRKGTVELTVADDGPGPQVQEPDRLFEPFHRAAPGTEGAGLGLAICAGIARAHGGRIRFDTVPSGARVRVTLPA